MKKILTIGNGIQDIFMEYKKLEIQNLLYLCGGGAANNWKHKQDY